MSQNVYIGMTLKPWPILLDHYILNGDKEGLDSEFTMRGKLVSLPNSDAIPDQVEPTLDEAIFGNSQFFQTMQLIQNTHFGKQLNKGLYRERANVLREWAGAELLYLTLCNDSSSLANGVCVELTIPRHKGLSIKVPESRLPKDPKVKEDYHDRFQIHSLRISQAAFIPDLRVLSDAKNYYIKWNVKRLQAQTILEADECVLFKTDKPVKIQCTIFCDELPEPTKTMFIANPPSETIIVSVDELSEELYYEPLRDQLIMNGYITRVVEDMVKEYELEN